MLQLLSSFFITGNEEAENRTAFQRLIMDQNETFPAFKARFISAAVKGRVTKEEWFFFMWEKVTPSLRTPNLGFKISWEGSFDKMVSHFTAYDSERRSPPNRLQTKMAPTPPSQTSTVKRKDNKDKNCAPTHRTMYVPQKESSPTLLRERSRTAPPASQPTPDACYNYRKVGHYASSCPEPWVREIAIEDELEEDWASADDTLPPGKDVA
ncbi:hypothetical protein EJ04DRAFT_571111 [Polyplosphaeria fusca]|uniref:Uncharacterized protein n=1 Tax=Polyplosphaeria fusca TaxID=682080 RepID=A0A9P4USD3_9PLEO|nr:hypothetical protein EJ04DRAFT_571111 [Polyplosphaeria fusca]